MSRLRTLGWILGVFASLAASGCERGDAPRTTAADVQRAQLAVGSASFSGVVPELTAGQKPLVQLKPTRFVGDSTAFATVNAVVPAGHYLIVIDRMADPHVALVDLTSGKVVNRLVRHGRGPGEAEQPLNAQVISTDPPEAWLYDFGTRRMMLLDLTAPRKDALLDEMRLTADQSFLDPHWVGGQIVANGLFVDQRLMFLDRTGRLRRIVELPAPFDAETMPNPTGRRLMNRSFLAVNPSRERMALVYQFGNRIDFLQTDGALLGTVTGPRLVELKYHLADDRFFWDDGNQVAYAGVSVTDRYVYALFSGSRLHKNEPVYSRVQVFEWDGDFVAEIGLGVNVHSISVSPDDRTLYGGVEIPYPVVAEWDLSPAWRALHLQADGVHGRAVH